MALPDSVGLHIGQSDLPIEDARRLLGPNRLLGHSVHNIEQAKEAVAKGYADYVGVGPVYGTQSKAGITDKDVLGTRGARQVIEALDNGHKRLPSVLIGGVNSKTASRTLFGSTSSTNSPDGIAVISGIVARTDPDVAARQLADTVQSYKASLGSKSARLAFNGSPQEGRWSVGDALQRSSFILGSHRRGEHGPPLIQTLTSHVSSTLSANIALAFSASPIMSHQEAEAEDLGKVTGAVVLNIGTIGEEARRGMRAVGNAANRGGKVSKRLTSSDVLGMIVTSYLTFSFSRLSWTPSAWVLQLSVVLPWMRSWTTHK